MNYREAWDFLDNLQFFKIKLGLDSMTMFMERLGSPHADLPCIHVAGTNGKGSVAATMLAILTRAGFKVGVYTSPHLTSVRERFRINKDFISQEEFTRHADRIIGVLSGDQITYFEFTTALAFLWFAERQVDFVILEVGMGGRLDATNIITPKVSVITNVAMDHEVYLGTTLAAIATEKAGVIKKGVPVVSGVCEPSAAEVISRLADEVKAPLYTLGSQFRMIRKKDHELAYEGVWHSYADLCLSLRGAYQADNTALALAALELLLHGKREIDDTIVRAALLDVHWPGRLEFFPDLLWRGERRAVLLDGAHNPAGVEALANALTCDFHYDRLIMVWASMGDKDFQTCVERVSTLCDTIIFTRPESLRSAKPEQLRLALPEESRAKCRASETVPEALEMAYDMAGPFDLICIAGSLYLIGKARSILVGDLVDG